MLAFFAEKKGEEGIEMGDKNLQIVDLCHNLQFLKALLGYRYLKHAAEITSEMYILKAYLNMPSRYASHLFHKLKFLISSLVSLLTITRLAFKLW